MSDQSYGVWQDTQGCLGGQSTIDKHGATIAIILEGCVFRHESSNGSKQIVVRSHKDGLRVGCTFISNEALGYLYELHKKFLNSGESRTHQDAGI